MTVYFFNPDTEKSYTTDADILAGLCEAASHIKAGGWCMIERNNKALMVTSIDQIFGGAS
jgi:hypothetical protein